MLFIDIVYKWLNTALDCDIKEKEFWDMTITELQRAIDSYRRKQKAQAQEKAYFDYTLADLIGQSVARLHSSANKMPPIYNVYTTLFEAEQLEIAAQKKRDEVFAARIKQFATRHNQKGVNNGE